MKKSDEPVGEEGDSPKQGENPVETLSGVLSSVMRSKEAEKAEVGHSDNAARNANKYFLLV